MHAMLHAPAAGAIFAEEIVPATLESTLLIAMHAGACLTHISIQRTSDCTSLVPATWPTKTSKVFTKPRCSPQSKPARAPSAYPVTAQTKLDADAEVEGKCAISRQASTGSSINFISICCQASCEDLPMLKPTWTERSFPKSTPSRYPACTKTPSSNTQLVHHLPSTMACPSAYQSANDATRAT